MSGFIEVVGGQPIDVEDSAAVSIKFTDGVLGTLLSGFYLDRTFKENIQRYHSHMKIWRADGWLQLSTFEDEPLQWYSTIPSGRPAVQKFDYEKGQRSYQPFVQAAVRRAAGVGEPPITSREGLHVLKAIYGFYEAAKTGKTHSIG